MANDGRAIRHPEQGLALVGFLEAHELLVAALDGGFQCILGAALAGVFRHRERLSIQITSALETGYKPF